MTVAPSEVRAEFQGAGVAVVNGRRVFVEWVADAGYQGWLAERP